MASVLFLGVAYYDTPIVVATGRVFLTLTLTPC